MIEKGATFTIKEAALGAGMDLAKFQSKYRSRVKAGEIPAGLKDLTYDQVLLVLRTRAKGQPDPRKVDMLRQQLKTDGYRGGTTPDERKAKEAEK